MTHEPAPPASGTHCHLQNEGNQPVKQVTPGGDFDWTVVLRDACGYPFAVGTADGEVAIQVAATAPRGTVRLGPGDVARLALNLAEATTRAHETRPAAPPFPGRAV